MRGNSRGSCATMVARTLALIAGLVVITTSTTDSDVCPTERAACMADSSCTTCMDAYSDDFGGCTPPSDSASCDDFDDFVCCAVSDCIDNGAFTDFVACTSEADECDTFDPSTCADGTVVLGENDDDEEEDDDEEDDDEDSDEYSWDEDEWEDSVGSSDEDSNSDSDSATPSLTVGAPVATGAALLLATTAAAALARL